MPCAQQASRVWASGPTAVTAVLPPIWVQIKGDTSTQSVIALQVLLLGFKAMLLTYRKLSKERCVSHLC